MRRTLLGLYSYFEFFLVAVCFVPLLGLVALLYRKQAGNRVRGRWMRRFGRLTSSLSPMWHFSVEGQPPADILERPYVVIANHESTSDPFLLSYLPWDMRWVAKESIFKLPLIGWLMRAGGDIPLRRGDADSAQQMLDECKRTLAHGVPVMLFPEGTRSPDGHLLPFKAGAFRLAIEAQVPILPVALAGTRNCRPKGSLWFAKARAKARVLPVISTTGLTLDDVDALREKSRQQIATAAAQLAVELGLVGAKTGVSALAKAPESEPVHAQASAP